MKKTIHLDGSAFHDLSGFYDEVERKLTRDLDWRIGRNLDAYNDVLRGGFRAHEYGEEIVLIWLQAEKSRQDLGQAETVRYYDYGLRHCHPSNTSHLKRKRAAVQAGRGKTLFDMIIEITRAHPHIELRLEG